MIEPQQATRMFKLTGEVIARNQDTRMIVTKGIDRSDNRTVAIKEQVSTNKKIEKLNEACEVQLKLEHQNINKVLAYYNEAERGKQVKHVLITHLCDSDLHKELLKRKSSNTPWTEPQLAYILVTLVDALTYCESKDICHRDLKPANVFLDKDGNLEIGDFEAVTNAAVLGCSYSVQGTRPYLSPKLRQGCIGNGRPVHQPFKSDVYALGVTILELALLETPSLVISDLHLLSQKIRSYITALHLSPDFKDVLREMLTVDEDTRPTFSLLKESVGRKLRVSEEAKKNLYYQPAGIDLGMMEERQCQVCGRQTPSVICLCKHPPILVCAGCENVHVANEPTPHAKLPKNHLQKFQSADTTNKVRSRLLQKQTFCIHIQEILSSLNGAMEEVIETYEKQIGELKLLMERDVKVLEEMKGTVERVRAEMDNNWILSLFEGGETPFEKLADVPTPYLSCSIADLPPPSPLVQIYLTERLSSLEHLNSPTSLPFLSPSEPFLSLYRPDLPDSPWVQCPVTGAPRISHAITFAPISREQLVACGGGASNKQLFLLNIFTGEIHPLEDSVCPRAYSGLIYVDEVVYIFGGAVPQSEKAAERLSLVGNQRMERKCADMPDALRLFTPSKWDSKVYLPGQRLHVYDPVSNEYTLIRVFRHFRDFPVSSIILEGTLYIFHSEGIKTINLARPHDESRTKACLKVKYVSNPSPIEYNHFVYLFGMADREIVRVDVQKWAVTSIPLS